MNIKKSTTLLLVATICTLVSCKKDPPPMPPPDPKDSIERTVLVYMNADNNLYDRSILGPHGQYIRCGALTDINEMEQAWHDSFGGALLVYLNAPKSSGKKPTLYLIKHDTDTEKINSEVLKTYDWQDSNDTVVLASVIADVMTIQPAEHYGLILWSHGTGWVPKGLGQPLHTNTPIIMEQNRPIEYTFGSSSSYERTEMEIDALARALPNDVKFDYIAFDACYMGGIEVAYEFRKKCRYFIGSAVETPIDGFEYHLIVEDMMRANVKEITRKTYEYYNSLSGWWATCAMSVVDCDKIEDLATTIKSLTINSPKSLSDIRFNEIQDLSSSYSFRGTYYDFADFINTTWAGDAGLEAFNQILSEVVVAKYNTQMNLDNYPIERYCGFSCFAPKPYQEQAIKAFRNRFAWSWNSGIGTMN